MDSTFLQMQGNAVIGEKALHPVKIKLYFTAGTSVIIKYPHFDLNTKFVEQYNKYQVSSNN